MNRIIIPIFVISFLFPTTLVAKTWRVEKGGFGDYTVIQDAVDASSSGDTIRIGPGRFNDFVNYSSVWIVVRVFEKDLTFVGAGAGSTNIGPEQLGDPDDQNVYCFVVIGDGQVTRISQLTCENVVSWGVRVQSPGRCEIDDCDFRGSSGGVYGKFRDGGWIRNCHFVDNNIPNANPTVTFYEPSVGVVVENCTFSNCGFGIDAYWGGCDDISVQDCTFDGGQTGVGFIDGASGSIVGCTMQNLTTYGIYGQSAGTVLIHDNVIQQIGEDGCCFATYYSPGDFSIRNNVFTAENVVLLVLQPDIVLDVKENHFLRVGNDAWYVRPLAEHWYTGPIVHLDFAGNWWGTDDPAVVAQWIWDGNDDPVEYIYFDYLPMLDGPVQTERTTWGAVKTLFRDATR